MYRITGVIHKAGGAPVSWTYYSARRLTQGHGCAYSGSAPVYCVLSGVHVRYCRPQPAERHTD
ncbi:DUF1187 family protein [Klebsiella variicola]